LAPSARIFIALDPVDMRGSFDRLAGDVRRLGADPLDGGLYLFVNRRRTLLRALWFDRTGWALLASGTSEPCAPNVHHRCSTRDVFLTPTILFWRPWIAFTADRLAQSPRAAHMRRALFSAANDVPVSTSGEERISARRHGLAAQATPGDALRARRRERILRRVRRRQRTEADGEADAPKS
jgi:hypothetical protein